MRERSIIHLNVADFAVAVERLVDHRLASRPVVIAPEGAARATVFDMSDEAFHSGVRKGMPLGRALRRCPDAEILPPHPDRYERAMRRLVKQVLSYSPLIEMSDINGHLFIDTTGMGRLHGPPPDIAWRIRKTVRTTMGLDPIWSVAPNKLIAKVATRLVKPTGEYIVRAGEETAFLHPIPLHLIPGIEPGDLARCREFNLFSAGQVILLSLNQLQVAVGRRCRAIYDAVRGIDPEPVRPVGRQAPVIRLDHAFGNDTNDAAVVEGALYSLVERAARELRRRKLAAGRIGIFLDYSDGARVIRQAAARPATANDFRLFAAARTALERAWTRRVRVRHIRLACDRLRSPPAQLELFPKYRNQQETEDNLIATLDAIRGKFGHEAIRVGRTLSAAA